MDVLQKHYIIMKLVNISLLMWEKTDVRHYKKRVASSVPNHMHPSSIVSGGGSTLLNFRRNVFVFKTACTFSTGLEK